MTPATSTLTPARQSRISAWALLPVALLGSLMAGLAWMIHLAVDDPGFAVEPDYYAQAVNWDALQAQRARSAALGWRIDWNFAATANGAPIVASTLPEPARAIGVRVYDATGQPLTGAKVGVLAFHKARAAELQHLALSEQSPGEYSAQLDLKRSGVWQLRLSVVRGAERYFETVNADLTPQQGNFKPHPNAPQPVSDQARAAKELTR